MRKRTKNHYEALGVDRNADSETIRSAYREKAKKHHPDSSGNGDTREFRAVQEAYEALRDPGTRSAYDRELRSADAEESAAASRRAPFADPTERPFRARGPFGRNRERDDRVPHADRPRGDAPRPSRPGFGGGLRDDLLDEALSELFGGKTGRRQRGPFEPDFGNDEPAVNYGRYHDVTTVVVHLSADEVYSGTRVQLDVAGEAVVVDIPPGMRDGQTLRSEAVGRRGVSEIVLKIRVD